MDCHGGGLTRPQQPLARPWWLPVFHLGKDAKVSPRLNQRADKHNSTFERLLSLIGKHNLYRDRTVVHLLGLKAGRVDIALNPQLIDADHPSEWITRLHPLTQMGIDLHHRAVDGRTDFPPLNPILRRIDFNLLGVNVECRKPPLKLGLLNLQFTFLAIELQPGQFDLGHATGDPTVGGHGLF